MYGAYTASSAPTCKKYLTNLDYESDVLQFVPNSFATGQAGSAWNLMYLLTRHPVVVYVSSLPLVPSLVMRLFLQPIQPCNSIKTSHAPIQQVRTSPAFQLYGGGLYDDAYCGTYA